MEPPESPNPVINLDEARRRRELLRKRRSKLARRRPGIRISVDAAGKLGLQESHSTKQDAYTLMLGCCIMMNKMFDALGAEWGS